MIAPQPLSPKLFVALAFALLLAAFDFAYRPFFPIAPGFVGDDYSLAMPAWLDGYYWFRNNGLATPWFTPSFCAGQPFFADPQSNYYSLPHLLAFVISPLAAAHLMLVICAALLFWGGYLLMRRVFGTGIAAATLVGGLLMWNGFVPHRLVIGHTGYHAFALTPWLALLLLMPVRSAADGLAAALAAGLILAYWVHAGFGTLILAGGLAVFLVALVHGLRGGTLARFFARGLLASLVGLGLAAAKLAASFAFLANFPRTDYRLPGADGLLNALTVIGGSLFLPSEWAHALGRPRFVNVQWELAPHEWAFNFGFAALLLAIVLVFARKPRPAGDAPPQPGRRLMQALLVAGLAWPLFYNTFQADWNAFLKTVPMLNSASTPLRWIIVYIPIVAVAIGLLLDRAGRGRWAVFAVAACLGAIAVQGAMEPRAYYRGQHFDVRPLQMIDAMVRAGDLVPAIRNLGTMTEIEAEDYSALLTGNDTFVAGISQLSCYNPVFGYRLEKFSRADLRLGPVLDERDGYLNLKNPACYVFPKENGCRPGDRFRAEQIEDARAFVAYRPYAFRISTRQQVANAITQAALALVAVAGLAWLVWTLRRRRATDDAAQS